MERSKRFNWGGILVLVLCLLFWFFIITLCCCHPTSQILEPDLIMEGDIEGSQTNGTPYLSGHVKNQGEAIAYEAVLNLRILETNDIFRVALGDIVIGESVAWIQKLKGYSWGDDINVNYSFDWRGK